MSENAPQKCFDQLLGAHNNWKLVEIKPYFKGLFLCSQNIETGNSEKQGFKSKTLKIKISLKLIDN